MTLILSLGVDGVFLKILLRFIEGRLVKYVRVYSSVWKEVYVYVKLSIG